MLLRSIATLVGRAAFLTICLCLSVNLASAATATWDGGGGDNNFRTPANWAGDLAPAPGDILAFDGGVRLTPNNNFAAGTVFGGIVFSPTAEGPFTLNGSLVNLNGDISDNSQAYLDTINLPLALQTSPTINVVNFGSLTIAGNISGNFGFTQTGGGLLTLSGGNTFTGPITLTNGALSISNVGQLGASTSTSPLRINGGSLLSTANITIPTVRPIILGPASGTGAGTFDVLTGNTVTYAGVIADNGAAGAGALNKIHFGTLTLSGQNTYTGATNIKNGSLVLNFADAAAPTTNIIAPSSTLTLGGATSGLGQDSNSTLTMTGKAGANNVQTFANTKVDIYGSVISVTQGTGGSAKLNLGALTHNVGGTVVIPTTAISPATAGVVNTTTSVATTNGILGGWAIAGTASLNRGIISGTDWATVDASGNIVPYTGYVLADPSTTIRGSGVIAANSDKNVRYVGTAASTEVRVDGENAGTTTDINTLAFTTAGANNTLTIGTGNTLRLGKFGGILKQTAGNNQLYIGGSGGVQTGNGTAGASSVGKLTAGGPTIGTPGEIVLSPLDTANNNGGMNIEASIVDNGPGGAVTLVKTGVMSVKIDGHNTFSGGLFINQGRFQLAGSEIGSANPDGLGTGTVTVAPGAYLFVSGVNSTTLFTGPTAIPGALANTAQNAPIPNNMTLSGIGDNQEPIGVIRLGGKAVLTGTITLGGDARIAGSSNNGNIALTYDTYPAINPDGTTLYIDPSHLISGKITGPFRLDVGAGVSVGTNFKINNHANDWTGNTTFISGGGQTILRLGNNEVIPDGVGKGNLVWGAGNNNAILDMEGFSETVNGLSTASSTNLAGDFIENDGFTATITGAAGAKTYTFTAGTSTLTVGGFDQSANFGGTIRDSETARSVSLPDPNGGTTPSAFTAPWVTAGAKVALTKIGAGTQTLSGINSYTGDTNVNNGALSVTGALSSSGVVKINTSATAAGALYGTGSMGAVTVAAAVGSQKALINPGATGAGSFGTLTMTSAAIGAGTDLQFDLQNASAGASDQLAVGSLSLGGPVTVSPSGTPVAGDYTVVQSTGPITGSQLSLNTANDTRLTFAFAPTSWNPGINANSQQVVIRVTGQSAHLVWSGTADATTWDLKTTQNWKNSDNANATDKFFNGDFVTFDDTGAPNFNISLGGTVQPGSITVNNSAGDYTINGGGGITGGGALVKNGTRALTISTTNSFSGGTTLNAGTLNVNSNAALGTGALTINGGILGNTSGQTVTLVSNPAQNWNADVTFNGPSDLNLGTGAVTSTVTGGTVRTVTVNGGTLTVGGTITDTAGSDGLTKAGAGTLVLGAANNFSGPVSINAGTVKVSDFGALGTNATPGTTIAAGATLDVGGFGAANVANGFGAMPVSIAGTGVGGAGAIINSGTLAQQNAFQNISLSADATVGGTGRFDIRGGTPVLNLNGHTLTKVGTNQFSLVGAAVNSGNVVVNQGTFSIEAATVIDNTVPADTITVNTGATLQFFANSGTVSRPIVINGDNVTINDGSGAAAVSTIASPVTAKGNLTFTGGNATANLIMNGAITESSGARSLTKSGASQLTLGAATNTYTGGTNLNGGVVTFSALGSLGTGPLTFNGGTLQYGSTATGDVSTLGITVNQGGGTIDTNGNVVALSKNITGPGGFGVKGNSTVLLTGTNTYAGPTTVQNGFLIVGSNGAIPNNTALVLGNTNNDNATFDLNGRSLNVSGLTTVANSTGNLTSGGPGNLTVTYNGVAAADTFNANITNGSAQSISLVVNSGNLSLGGGNTYTGTTKVNNTAKLFVNGSHFSSGAYTVASGATLGGIASTDAAVTIASGATLAPGTANGGLGTLSVNSATIAGTLQFRINDADPFLNSSLTTSAALALQSATLSFNITGVASQQFYILAHYGTLTGNPFTSVLGLPNAYTLDYHYQGQNQIALVSSFLPIQTGDFNRDGHTNSADVLAMMQALTDVKTYQSTKSVSNAQLLQIGDFNADGKFNNLDMQPFLAYISVPANNNVAPVPEPASLALLALGGLGLAEVCRRRRSGAGRN